MLQINKYMFSNNVQIILQHDKWIELYSKHLV